jgi:hypothetical protein
MGLTQADLLNIHAFLQGLDKLEEDTGISFEPGATLFSKDGDIIGYLDGCDPDFRNRFRPTGTY